MDEGKSQLDSMQVTFCALNLKTGIFFNIFSMKRRSSERCIINTEKIQCFQKFQNIASIIIIFKCPSIKCPLIKCPTKKFILM